MSARLRLLSIGPLPPAPSGVADYSAALLTHLAELAEIAVAVADDAALPPLDCPLFRASELSPAVRARFDLPVFHVGNHRLHAFELPLLAEWPGLVVLHDAVLHHLYADLLLGRRRAAAYLREVAFAAPGAVPRATATATSMSQPAWFEQPALGRVLANARGVIVHSRHALDAVRRAGVSTPARLVHHAVATPPAPPAVAEMARSARERHGLAPGAFVVGTFGGLTREKRVGSVVAAFERLGVLDLSVRLIMAGEAAPDVRIPPEAIATGRLPLDELEALIAACDVVVQLRWPTAGEASGVTLRAMRLGRATIVADCGWFAELPDDAVAKIPADVPEDVQAELLADQLIRLAGDPAERARLSSGALDFARASSFRSAAAAYVSFADELLRASDGARPGRFLDG